MEDIISTILDVVRAQHTATKGTDQKPFDMDDVVDMAMGVIGRPEKTGEAESMAESIQKMVESMAPDLFPPRTFEQMDDEEKTASVTSMLESRLRNGFVPRARNVPPQQAIADQVSPEPSLEKAVSSEPSLEKSVPSEPAFAESVSAESFRLEPEYPQPASVEPAAPPSALQSTLQTPGQAFDSFTEVDMNALADSMSSMIESYQAENGGSGELDPRQTAELNDLIYKNLMEVMGAQPPKVEFPFDRSQIRYGREKTITEQLEEEERERKNADSGRSPVTKVSAADLAQSYIDKEEPSQLTAWDLAQNAVNEDEEKHKKKPFVPTPVQEPQTKTASQLAAEAIARAQEEDKMKLEIERQAEALMAEAAKRGQDPMKFALHQQEILRYMEKNSDELVSFEDYEDLTPEEKLEVERQIYIEKQIADGVDPDKVDTEVPAEYIPPGLKADSSDSAAEPEEEGTKEAGPDDQAGTPTASAAAVPPVMTEEMLRMLSQEVVRENSDMILAENADEDMEGLSQIIFENLKKMMDGSGEPVPQEDVGDLIEQAIAANRKNQIDGSTESDGVTESAEATQAAQAGQSDLAAESAQEAQPTEAGKSVTANQFAEAGKSAAAIQSAQASKVAQAAQAAQSPEASAAAAAIEKSPAEETEIMKTGMSAAELARAAQKAAKADIRAEKKTLSAEDLAKEAQLQAMKTGTKTDENESAESDSILDIDLDIEADPDESWEISPAQNIRPEDEEDSAAEGSAETEEESAGKESAEAEEEEDWESPDPYELVLGDHTQAEVDEALDNLATLGLTGDVYERAKRMLLLELAGSEAELDSWLAREAQKKKDAGVAASRDDIIEDINDVDEDELERELELAMDEDFLDEDFAEDEDAVEEIPDTKEPEAESKADQEKTDAAEVIEGTEISEKEISGQESSEDIIEEITVEEISGDEITVEESSDGEASVEEVPVEESSDGEASVEEVPMEESSDEEASGKEVLVEESSDEEASGEEVLVEESSNKEASGEEVPVEESSDEEAFGKGVPVEESSDEEISDEAIPEKKASEVENAEAAQEESGKKEISTRKPFVLKNSASFMDQFEDFILDTQENRKLSTGFKKLDAMLRYGLHKGSYFIDSQPQYLKNGFMQQIADRAAESGIDVLYISTELSRYDLMVETISRLSFEIHEGDPASAVSAMDIMTGENGADLASLKDELNWYRGRISEHLFIVDQEAVADFAESAEAESAGDVLIELISSIVRDGAHKPVVFIDNIENILSTEDSEDMKPLIEGISKLAKELGIPVLMSYGYAQAESEAEMYPEEREYHESIGNMCDVYLELAYADMITEDLSPLGSGDIMEMVEKGESLLINILLHKNRRPMKASLQIQGTPKYNYFGE